MDTSPQTKSGASRAPACLPNEGRRGWFRFGVADLLLLVLVIGMVQRSQGSMLDDPGLGWHLRNVDAMWAEGGWLTQDPFSGPRNGQPWRTNQWLGDLVLYFGWWWGGMEGIAAVTTLVLAFSFRFLYRMLLADDVPWPLALGWTILAALGTSLAWAARPNIFTLLLVMVTAWTLDRYHRGRCRRATTWWLVPLFTLWANTHGGFVAGLILIAATMVVESGFNLFAAGVHRSQANNRLKHLACLLPACILATLVNPYGWSLYPWIFQLLGNEFFMNLHTEWLSPNFHARGAIRFEFLILLFPTLLAFGRRRTISLVELAHSILWLHFAFSGERYVPLWVVVSVPLMARLSADVLVRLRRLSDPWVRPSQVLLPVGSPLGALLITLGLLVWARGTEGYSGHHPNNVPVDALTYVVEHHAGDVIFHDYGWGGWLIWHGWPTTKSWIDDRNEVQGEAQIERYFRIVEAREGWNGELARVGTTVACISAQSRLAEHLANDASWQLRYRDKFAVVYELAVAESAQSNDSEKSIPVTEPSNSRENGELSLLRDLRQ
ncbi:MAG: hypothetical protein WBF93_14535 [Pirellulales bacterium]